MDTHFNRVICIAKIGYNLEHILKNNWRNKKKMNLQSLFFWANFDLIHEFECRHS